MLQAVDVGERSFHAYAGVVPETVLDAVLAHAAPLRGLRVLNVNATPYGGGVSELLRSTVPLLTDLGLVVDWQVISGDTSFFQVTKVMHNGLQGSHVDLGVTGREAYRATSARNARELQGDYDVIVVHDPQPAALRQLAATDRGDGPRWVWRCHIDTSEPNPATWGFLKDYLEGYDAAVFTMSQFVPKDLPPMPVAVIPPAIDPLSPKNLPLPRATAEQLLEWVGVRTAAPMMTQVARFDPWKDPLGVIEAYRLVREEVPELQLVLAGSMALDDPEGWQVYERIRAETARDPLVHVLSNLTGVGNIEVNALQRCSDVVVQKSVREGFGLVVSEALWKGTPVVAGRAGGIPLQMADGVGGYLVGDVEGCAEAVLHLLRDPLLARQLGHRGRERVRQHFLLPHLLLNELALLAELSGPRRPSRLGWAARHDPVCGLAIEGSPEEHRAEVDHTVFGFCSSACRSRFLEEPARWVPELRHSPVP